MSLALTTLGQDIVSYKLSMRAGWLPGGNGRSEIYSKTTDGKFDHKSTINYRKGKRGVRKIKERRLRKSLKIEDTINALDSLFRLTEFKFTIDTSIIHRIVAHNLQNNFRVVYLKDIDRFFSQGDTVILNLKDIKEDEFNTTVIDGGPFSFNLTFKRANQDSIKYEFVGNFEDNVKTINIKSWLPIYLAYRQNKFFQTLPMEYYFTDSNLEGVLIRFIDWTK